MKNIFFLLIIVIFNFSNLFSQIGPTLKSPANHDSCQSQYVLLEWEAVPNATSYRIEVSDTNNFSRIIISANNIDVTYIKIFVASWQKRYYWRAFSVFPGNTEGKSQEWNFKTKMPPVELISPTDEMSCLDTNITFKWRKSNAEFYVLQLALDSNFNNIITEKNNIIDTTITLNIPHNTSSIYWRVAALKSTCLTDWSEKRTFTFKQKAPKLIYPENNAKGGTILNSVPFYVTLKWQKQTDAIAYDVQVSLKSDFSTIFYSNSVIGDTIQSLSLGAMFDTTIYWRVRSITNRCTGYWSEIYKFYTPYNKPILTLPLNNELCISLKQNLFKWTVVPKAVRYTLEISLDSNFQNIHKRLQNLNENQATTLLTLPLTNLYWRVRAEDNLNNGLWSDKFKFTTTQKEPSNIFPPNNSVGNNKSIILKWESFVNSKYDLKLSLDEGFTKVIIDTTLLDTNFINVDLPENNKIYYWIVRARTGSCIGDWTDILNFKTIISPPQLISPKNNEIISTFYPIFNWTTVADANIYDIDIATDVAFKKIFKSRTQISSNTFTFPGEEFPELTTFYWRVRAQNQDGRSLWSDTFQFSTKEAPPAAPELIFPSNGSTKLPLEIVFKWQNIKKAKNYEIEISKTNSFTESLYKDLTNDTSYTVVGLDLFTNYFWRVRGINDGGNGNWSKIFSFRTKDLAPEDITELVYPANGQENLPISFTFKWNNVNRALGYELNVATNSNFEPSSIVSIFEKIYNTEKVISGLEYNKNYFWRVRAWNEDGKAPWSAVRSFKTLDITKVDDDDSYFESFNVNPNPVINNIVEFNFTLKESTKVNLKIYNLLGKEVYSTSDVYYNIGKNSIQINTNKFNPGVYFYKLSTINKTYNGSFIIK